VQVYSWWKNGNFMIPYPSTLYVTAKSIEMPSAVDPAMRSMHAVQEVNYLSLFHILLNFVTTCIKNSTKKPGGMVMLLLETCNREVVGLIPG